MAIKVRNVNYVKKAKEYIRSQAFFNEEELTNKQINSRYRYKYNFIKSKLSFLNEEALQRFTYFDLLKGNEGLKYEAKALGSYREAFLYNIEEQMGEMANTYKDVRAAIDLFAEGAVNYNEFLDLIKEFKEDPNGAYMKKEMYR